MDAEAGPAAADGEGKRGVFGPAEATTKKSGRYLLLFWITCMHCQDKSSCSVTKGLANKSFVRFSSKSNAKMIRNKPFR